MGIPINKNVPLNTYESHHCINLQREESYIYFNVLPYITMSTNGYYYYTPLTTEQYLTTNAEQLYNIIYRSTLQHYI